LFAPAAGQRVGQLRQSGPTRAGEGGVGEFAERRSRRRRHVGGRDGVHAIAEEVVVRRIAVIVAGFAIASAAAGTARAQAETPVPPAPRPAAGKPLRRVTLAEVVATAAARNIDALSADLEVDAAE